MKRAKALSAALILGGLAGGATSARAQTTVGADLDLFSSYVWRGLSLTNKPVAQPNVYLTVPAGNASLTVGGWANVELGQYDDPADDLSQAAGISSFNLAEFDPYAEVSVPAGKATLAAGVVGYIFPNDEGFTSDLNTWEVYGRVGLDTPLAPSLAVYYDFDKVDGLYIEGSLSHSLPFSERVSLDLGALAGVSAGQHADFDELGDPQAGFFNFAENGLTHLDLSAGLPLSAGVFSITPVLHLVINGDDFSKFTSPTDESDVKLWGGVSVSWSRALGLTSE